MATVDLQSTNESGMLYYDHQFIKEQLDGLDTSNSINDKLNGITNEVNRKGVIHRKVYSSAAEETTTSATKEDSGKTFNLAAPVNSLIIGINVYAELKHSSASGYSYISLKINGTNLGTNYLNTDKKYFSKGSTEIQYHWSPSLDTSEGNLFYVYGSSYEKMEISYYKPIKVLDATTTFLVRKSASGSTGYLKNVVIEVIYVENFEEDA